MSLTGLDLRTRARRHAATLLDRIADTLDPAEVAPPEPRPAPAPAAAPPTPPPQAPAPAAEPPPLKPLPPIRKALEPLPRPKDAATPAPPKARKSTTAPAPAAAPASEPPAATKARKSTPAPAPAAAPAGETPAAKKARQSPEERQAAHWKRTREGLLRFVHEHGGSASLRELHDHSEQTYFVAHVGFSRMMEELTDEGLLDYDHDTATASLTDEGRTEIL